MTKHIVIGQDIARKVVANGNDDLALSKGSTDKLVASNSGRIVLEGRRDHTYYVEKDGIYRKTYDKRRKSLICGPVKFLSHLVMIDSDQIRVLVGITDVCGERKKIEVPRADVIRRGALIDQLANTGLLIVDRESAAEALPLLYAAHPPKRNVKTTNVPGWVETKSCAESMYVTNLGAVKPSGCSDNVVLANAETPVFATSGTLEDWNLRIGNLCAEIPTAQFAVSMSLASFLLKSAGLPNFGVEFYGASKTGKTFLFRIVASVNGTQDQILNWNATANAIEIYALQHNDFILLLDEIDQADGRTVSEAIYDLANGRTKGRLNREASISSGKRFRGLLMSNGEQRLRDHLLNSGISVKRGQEVRLAGIKVPDNGIFSDQVILNLVDALNDKVSPCYGTLGRAFIELAVSKQSQLKAELPSKVSETAKVLLTKLKQISDHGTFSHVAKGFALVEIAGEMAIEAGLLNWGKGAVTKAVTACFKRWAAGERKNATLTEHDVFNHLQRFFQSERAGKFPPFADYGMASNSNHAGYSHVIDGTQVFLVYPAYFEATLCKQFGKKLAVRILKQKNLLVLGGRDTPTRQVNIPKRKGELTTAKQSFYVIRDAILSADY